MGEVITRCVSRQTALMILEKDNVLIPAGKQHDDYMAALNRVRFEFRRHEPIRPNRMRCGDCGVPISPGDVFCANCGREIYRG